jgi:hypothetical protein
LKFSSEALEEAQAGKIMVKLRDGHPTTDAGVRENGLELKSLPCRNTGPIHE